MPELTEHGEPMTIVPTNSMFTLNSFLTENPDLAFPFLVGEITKAVANDWEQVELFRVGNTPFVARVMRTEFSTVLEDAMKYYTKMQNFEMAKRCRILLDRHKVNLLLESTKSNKETRN